MYSDGYRVAIIKQATVPIIHTLSVPFNRVNQSDARVTHRGEANRWLPLPTVPFRAAYIWPLRYCRSRYLVPKEWELWGAGSSEVEWGTANPYHSPTVILTIVQKGDRRNRNLTNKFSDHTVDRMHGEVMNLRACDDRQALVIVMEVASDLMGRRRMMCVSFRARKEVEVRGLRARGRTLGSPSRCDSLLCGLHGEAKGMEALLRGRGGWVVSPELGLRKECMNNPSKS